MHPSPLVFNMNVIYDKHHASVCGVYVPHVCTHGIGCTLECPREQSELSSEVLLIKAFRIRGETVQVLTESIQSVLTMAVDHMTERCIHH